MVCRGIGFRSSILEVGFMLYNAEDSSRNDEVFHIFSLVSSVMRCFSPQQQRTGEETFPSFHSLCISCLALAGADARIHLVNTNQGCFRHRAMPFILAVRHLLEAVCGISIECNCRRLQQVLSLSLQADACPANRRSTIVYRIASCPLVWP